MHCANSALSLESIVRVYACNLVVPAMLGKENSVNKIVEQAKLEVVEIMHTLVHTVVEIYRVVHGDGLHSAGVL